MKMNQSLLAIGGVSLITAFVVLTPLAGSAADMRKATHVYVSEEDQAGNASPKKTKRTADDSSVRSVHDVDDKQESTKGADHDIRSVHDVKNKPRGQQDIHSVHDVDDKQSSAKGKKQDIKSVHDVDDKQKSTKPADQHSIKGFNPQPDPPGKPGSVGDFNPQPDPPGKPQQSKKKKKPASAKQ